jgi:hypothetical protein
VGEALADLAAVLRQSTLCWRCLAAKTGMTAGQLDEALARLREHTAIAVSLAPCDGCQRNTLLYRIG